MHIIIQTVSFQYEANDDIKVIMTLFCEKGINSKGLKGCENVNEKAFTK